MNRLNISISILPIIPCLALFPVLIDLASGIHYGGINTVTNFFVSAFVPSLEKTVIGNSINSLMRTISVAYISWLVSLIIGLFIGISSSNFFSNIFDIPSIYSISLRNLFAIPRAIHELVWGLLLQGVYGLGPLIAIIAISIPYSFLFAKVVSDQIDTSSKREITTLKQLGASPFHILSTCLIPKIKTILLDFGGYRFECALRGATLLGIFGLGGIGTELSLTLKSLQFKEMWTSLWLLLGSMYIVEILIKKIRLESKNIRLNLNNFSISITIIIIIFLYSLGNIIQDNFIIPEISNYAIFNLPNITEFKLALSSLNYIVLAANTLILTLLSAFLSTSIPPILVIICQNKIWLKFLGNIWIFMRLIPPPVTALLLLMCFKPSISIAVLALGIHNIGIMGRQLIDGISNLNTNYYSELISVGTNPSMAWLYGVMSRQSRSYLSYAAYRMDVILRETTIVGVVGGVGLGWQLQESLTSFAWAEVISIIITYIIITITIESISNKIRMKWIQKPNHAISQKTSL